MPGGLINSNQQAQVSEQRRMPVDNVGSDTIRNISGETLQFYYYNSGVLTIDAGEAAGTVVVGKLANRNVKNALGDVTGTHLDTSVAFTTGTILTELVEFPAKVAETWDRSEGETKAIAITNGFTNGQYCIDHRTGTVYGKKATTGVSDTVAYKIETNASSTPGGVSSEVEIVDSSGNNVDTTEDTASSGRGFNVYGTRADFDGSALPELADTEGDSVSQSRSGEGVAYVMLVNADGSAVGQIAGYDPGTDSNKMFEINPLSEHHVEETLADVTNGADGTYYYYVDMDGYKHFSSQLELSGGSGTCTVTVEATNQDDGTAAASCTYQDVTSGLFGSASFTASNFLIADTAQSFKYIRYKVVASTTGADDADWTIYHKKQY
mgnify:CR=1 FL=1